MFRNLVPRPSTDFHTLLQAWSKAQPVGGGLFGQRVDDYGWLIDWAAYGDRDHPLGWEIDHIVPVSRGGSDHPSNLRALNWRMNAQRGNRYDPIEAVVSGRPLDFLLGDPIEKAVRGLSEIR